MNDGKSQWRMPVRVRRLTLAVIGLTLIVFGVTIYVGTLRLRQSIREQIAGRDGEILHAVAQMLENGEEGGVQPGELGQDPATHFVVILKASRLKGVLATRLFDAEGKCYESFPAYVTEGALSPAELERLQQLQTVSRYHPAARLADLFLHFTGQPEQADRTAPLLEVIIPLHSRDNSRLLGVAQFFIDGQSIRDEFVALDRHLFRQASTAFLAGGLIIAAALGWGFRRLQRTNRLLEERTNHLQQANRELVLAAKTSAVGAVTAHLLHGLRNPLSGLQNFVASRARDPANGTDLEWENAFDSTRRMHNLINEVVGVLRDAQEITDYEVSLAELVELVHTKVLPLTRNAGVKFAADLKTNGNLSGRVANLVMLILINLIQNAIEATPRGRSVRLTIGASGADVDCEVRDEGPGFPEPLRPSLFAPSQSTKDGSAGIGLAISKQLANHLEAKLELKSSSPTGCAFSLVLPAKLVSKEASPVVSSDREFH